MKLAPQERRTFFVSFGTFKKQVLFKKAELAELFIEVTLDNRAKGRMQVHEFAVMYDHVHVILTPALENSLEKAVQFLKGGFSFRVKKELGFRWDVWQPSFNEHRITDKRDYREHVVYTHMNPVRAGYVTKPEDYPYSSASGRWVLDPPPEHLRG